MLDQPQGRTEAKLLAELPLRLHHHAFAVKDQEANRHFIEDILGIPLVATWCERVFFSDVGREVEFCHTFFEIKDGGALAFFQYADEAAWQSRGAPAQDGGAQHIKGFKNRLDQTLKRFEPSLGTYERFKRSAETLHAIDTLRGGLWARPETEIPRSDGAVT